MILRVFYYLPVSAYKIMSYRQQEVNGNDCVDTVKGFRQTGKRLSNIVSDTIHQVFFGQSTETAAELGIRYMPLKNISLSN